MHSKMLLPHRFKAIGLVLLVPSLVLGYFTLFHEFKFNWLEVNFGTFGKKLIAIIGDMAPGTWGGTENYTNEIAYILCIIALVLVGFSKEKQEDEFIFTVRLESLLWAVYVNIVLLILITLFIYGLDYYVFILFASFAFLLIFIIRFNYLIHFKAR